MIILVSTISYALFSFLDRHYIDDLALDITIADITLAIVLTIVSIAASKYFSDTTTNSILQELKKLESRLDQKIKDLESKLDN